MGPAAIAILALVTLAAMSLTANARFRAERRLPMQWSRTGAVNWTAPRPLALAFTPLLAALCLSATAASATFIPSRPGQEGLVIPALIAAAGVFIGAHALHLWLIARTLRPKS
ncbi:hypothetical protein [Phenylobacterium sp.]|uniref:hypothetical protein n=1 Tax=Phenylobacterium sp. TaxID=1871053 RepID=UPI002FE28407